MRTINYKGFELDVEAYNNTLEIHKVEASITNQIALLTAYLMEDNLYQEFVIELDYKYGHGDGYRSYYIDFRVDIDKWLLINPSMQQKVLIELLMLEENEIMEQIGEVV